MAPGELNFNTHLRPLLTKGSRLQTQGQHLQQQMILCNRGAQSAETVCWEPPTPTMHAAQGCHFQLDLVSWTKPLHMLMGLSYPEDQLLFLTTAASSTAGEHLVQAQNTASDRAATKMTPVCVHRSCADN